MKKVILVILVIVSFYSCNKNDDPITTEETTSSYLPMAVGNYWIYQKFETRESDSSIFFPYSQMDSTCISKDTLINGRTFFKFVKYRSYGHPTIPLIIERTDYYADSAKHLINPKGEIVFSENNFTDILYRNSDVLGVDTATWLTHRMEVLNQIVTVPAGEFMDVLNVRGTVICNPRFTKTPNPRYVNKYYAKNVGNIMHSHIYVAGGGIIEWRLLRCHVNK